MHMFNSVPATYQVQKYAMMVGAGVATDFEIG